MIDLTALTPSIPERAAQLVECVMSVTRQAEPPAAHLIRVEQPTDQMFGSHHIAHQCNVLLPAVDTEWLARCDDDDLYLPEHFAAMAPHFDDADVVYTFGVGIELHDVTAEYDGRIAERLAEGNLIPGNAAVRTSFVREVGGWTDAPYRVGMFDDWDLWIRVAAAGARFRCVPVETWVYRRGPWRRTTGPRP